MGKRYNLINIRALLKEGFSDAELRDFCFDVPDFRPVYDQLAQNTGKAELVRLLLEFAHQKVKLDPLLAWAEKTNPAQFKAHQPYFKDSPPPSDADPPLSYLSALRDPALAPPPASSPPRVPESPPTPQPSNLPTSNPPAFQASTPSLRVFLCHTAADKPAVRDLYHRLRADGFEPWLDEEDLLPGQKWQAVLKTPSIPTPLQTEFKPARVRIKSGKVRGVKELPDEDRLTVRRAKRLLCQFMKKTNAP